MKKAKLMLAAIAVFAIVGGALAFKAKDSAILRIYKPDAANTTCIFSTSYLNSTSTNVEADAALTLTSATVTQTSDETKCANDLFIKPE